MTARRFVGIGLVMLIAPAAEAQVPHLFGYQGRLLRADGTAATGTASVTFAVFDSETGGTPVWQETQTLGLSEGYYSTFLGLVAPPPESLLPGGPRWLEVRVGSETLSPRQQLGTVPYAMTAQSVRGGAADVALLKIDGQTIIDTQGRLSGSARYSAGQGLFMDDAGQVVSLQACAAGQVLVHDASSWLCAPAGTVTGIDADAPLSATESAVRPRIAMSQAASNSAGFLSSLDWSAFNSKYGALTQCGGDLSGTLGAPVVARLQTRPVSGGQPGSGQVLKWMGTQWEPAADANSGGTVRDVTAVAPLSVWNGTSIPQISILQAGAGSDGFLSAADWARFEAKYGATTQCGGDLEGALANPLVARIQGVRVSTSAPAAAQVLRYNGTLWVPASLSISDVGGLSSGYLDLSGDQTIGGTKIFDQAPAFGTPLGVASGGIGTASAAANAFFAGPAGGSAGIPGFRALVAADVPGVDASKIVSGTLGVANGGIGTATASVNTLFAGPSGGASGTPGFRSLMGADIPNLDASKLTTGTLGIARGGTGTSTPFAQGSIVFAGPGGAYGETPALHWNDTLGRLGIGTASPGYRLDVQGGDASISGTIYAGGMSTPGNISVTGSGRFTGDGSGLSGVVASATVQVADASTTCTSGQTGQVRYASGHFQGCNGTNWTQLDNAPAPAITSVTPSEGTTVGGTVITIAGANFQPLATVTIGGTSCPVVSGSITSGAVQCTTPASSAGPKTVVVVNPDSQSGLKVDGFTYRGPTITGVTPTGGGVVGGTTITIAGSYFAGSTVKVGSNNASITSVTSTSIVATTPAGAAAGAASVAVTNSDSLQASGSFTYYWVPGWYARRPVTFTNATGGTLSSYTAQLRLDTAAAISGGVMRTDCGDLRMTDSDGTTVIPHFLDAGCNTSSTLVWVKVPSLPSGGKAIYANYSSPSSTSTSSASSAFASVMTGVLVAWKMDEGSGTSIADSSGNGYTAGTGSAPWTTGKFGGGLAVNGHTAQANVSALPVTTGFTVDAWAYPTSYDTSHNTIMGQGNGFLLAFQPSGNIANYVNTSPGGWTGDFPGTSIPLNAWCHAGLTYDGSTLRSYVNGAAQSSGTSKTGNMSSLTQIGIGQRPIEGGPQYFHGTIDEVRIFNRALSSTEMSALHTNCRWSTTSVPGTELLRPCASPEPAATVGAETRY